MLGQNGKNWWRRKEETEYMPPVSKDSLLKVMRANGIEPERKLELSDKNRAVARTLATIRQWVRHLSPVQLIYALLSTALLISRS